MKVTYTVSLVSILIFSIGCGPSSPPAKGSDKVSASIMAEQFIKDTLKAPGSAEFSSYSETWVAYNEATDSYTVRGWVDAQNSFGAKLRSRYVCILRNTEGDTWRSSTCHLVE